MKRRYFLPVLIASAVGLSGCATHPYQSSRRNEFIGAIVGGIVGGMIGYGSAKAGPAGGRSVTTIGGTLVGAFLGDRVGAAMDKEIREHE